jgi:endonuclease YncB( thermonuclease family)
MKSRRAKRDRWPLSLLWGALALEVCLAPAQAACGRAAGSVEVVAVDDRLDLELTDGRSLRLGGLDTPSRDRGSSPLFEAARGALVALLAGKPAQLLLIAPAPDRWGRVVADLVPLGAQGDETAAAALLRAGYARVRPEFETRACAPDRLAKEAEARRAGLGVWSDPAFAVLPADDGKGLRKYDGQFVIVEGKVRRVGFGGSRLYLDLGPRGGATVVVERKLEPILAGSGKPVNALVGQTIRARGAVDGRFRPRIDITDPSMVEFVRRSDATGDEDLHP